jgi:hypothetical protein
MFRHEKAGSVPHWGDIHRTSGIWDSTGKNPDTGPVPSFFAIGLLNGTGYGCWQKFPLKIWEGCKKNLKVVPCK